MSDHLKRGYGDPIGLIREQCVEIARLRYAVADLEAQHAREWNRARECETAIGSALERGGRACNSQTASAVMREELERVPKCGTCRDKAGQAGHGSCTACGRGCWTHSEPKRRRGK